MARSVDQREERARGGLDVGLEGARVAVAAKGARSNLASAGGHIVLLAGCPDSTSGGGRRTREVHYCRPESLPREVPRGRPRAPDRDRPAAARVHHGRLRGRRRSLAAGWPVDEALRHSRAGRAQTGARPRPVPGRLRRRAYGRRDDGRLGRSPSLRLPPGDRPAVAAPGGGRSAHERAREAVSRQGRAQGEAADHGRQRPLARRSLRRAVTRSRPIACRGARSSSRAARPTTGRRTRGGAAARRSGGPPPPGKRDSGNDERGKGRAWTPRSSGTRSTTSTTPAGHVEAPDRAAAIVAHLEQTDLWPRLPVLAPRPATVDDLLTVHTAAHIEHVREAAESGGAWLDPDTFASARSYEVALLAVGGALEIVSGWQRGLAPFALVRPPGHHAMPDHAMGFCLFDNIAILARRLLADGLERVAHPRLGRAPRQRHPGDLLRRPPRSLRLAAPVAVLSGHRLVLGDGRGRRRGVHGERAVPGGLDRRRLRPRLQRAGRADRRPVRAAGRAGLVGPGHPRRRPSRLDERHRGRLCPDGGARGGDGRRAPTTVWASCSRGATPSWPARVPSKPPCGPWPTVGRSRSAGPARTARSWLPRRSRRSAATGTSRATARLPLVPPMPSFVPNSTSQNRCRKE